MGVPDAPRESRGVQSEVPKILTQGTMGGGIPITTFSKTPSAVFGDPDSPK
jgi:hypothetical protein